MAESSCGLQLAALQLKVESLGWRLSHMCCRRPEGGGQIHVSRGLPPPNLKGHRAAMLMFQCHGVDEGETRRAASHNHCSWYPTKKVPWWLPQLTLACGWSLLHCGILSTRRSEVRWLTATDVHVQSRFVDAICRKSVPCIDQEPLSRLLSNDHGIPACSCTPAVGSIECQ